MQFDQKEGVPKFMTVIFRPKTSKYCVLIPIINEGNRIRKELSRAKEYDIDKIADIIICDGCSSDGSLEGLQKYNVNTLLIKSSTGKYGTQLRMGFWWALQRGYEGIITIDGNNKDSIEDIPYFIEKLEEGYDFIQGSRFIEGGEEINTPLIRKFAVKWLHAPIISKTAGKKYTDTTNAFRAYSRRYLTDDRVQPFRDIFNGYELLAYLSVRADQIGLHTCEIPVRRAYPKKGKTPTKISMKGNFDLLKILFANMLGKYKPKENISGYSRKKNKH